jgi:menaquinone-9 beta-reductase
MLASRNLTETITIIGGGLTGLSLAIALRKNQIPLVLHEAGTYPRHRVCGEFISGITPQTIAALGIEEPLADALRHHGVTWFSGDKLLRKDTLAAPALAISRHLLDDRLQQAAAAAGAEIHTRSRQKPGPHIPGTVWAAGRKPVPGPWIGLKAHIRGIPTGAHLEMHSGPIGYLGITAIHDGWNNACGIFKIDRSISAQHQDLLPAYLRKNGNLRLAEQIAAAEWKPGSFTAVAGFELGLQAPSPGLLSLGDSHAIIPPFTGNGMTMAFQSAEVALPHLIAYARHQSSWSAACSAIEKNLHQRFSTRLTAARLLHPLLFHRAARPLLRHAPIKPILSLVR